MRRVRAWWWAGCAVAGLAVLPASAGQQQDATTLVTGPVKAKQVCMLNNYVIKVDKEGVTYIHKGKTYYFCCANCVRQFTGNPDGLSKAVDPVSEEDVDKAKAQYYAYHDAVYYFASGANLREFAGDPESYLNAKKGKDAHAKPAPQAAQRR